MKINKNLYLAIEKEYVKFYRIIYQAKVRATREGKFLNVLCGESHMGLSEFLSRLIITNICLRLKINHLNLEREPGMTIDALSDDKPLDRFPIVAYYSYAFGASLADIDINYSSLEEWRYEEMLSPPSDIPYARCHLAVYELIKSMLLRDRIMVESILSQGQTHSLTFIGYGHMLGIANILNQSRFHLTLPIDLTNIDLATIEAPMPDMPWLSQTKDLPRYETMSIPCDKNNFLNSTSLAPTQNDTHGKFIKNNMFSSNIDCFFVDDDGSSKLYFTAYKAFLKRFGGGDIPKLKERYVYPKNQLNNIRGTTNVINEILSTPKFLCKL